MSSFLGRANLSRGLRNNNPGNLVITSDKWQGKIYKPKNTDARFEQFIEIKYGIRAMLRDVINDILKGKDTVRKVISEYAPAFENNTNAYVNAVSEKLGVNPDAKITVIDSKFMLLLARAIISHENGQKDGDLIKDSDIKSAISILGKFTVPSKIKVDNDVITSDYLLIPVIIFFYTVLTVAL
ncbi:hypothetical protein [Flavobacterium sp. LB1P71]|uniref:hypothetical protein n=1 Tax=Flavobacterium sp. LB1P71 TaxID=3401716 RepID=UPI003AAB3B3C